MGLNRLHCATKHLLQRDRTLADFQGWRIACDASSWLHRSGVVHARAFFLGSLETKPWCSYVHDMLLELKGSNIQPIVVFDGPRRVDLKNEELGSRGEKKKKAMHQAIALEASHRIDDAEKMWMQAFSVTSEMLTDVIDMVKEMEGVEYVIADYEADYEIAKLYATGQIDACITEDSDLVGYGVDQIIFKYCLQTGNFDYLDCTRPYEHVTSEGDTGTTMAKGHKKATLITLHNLTRDQRALLATFMGNDYLQNPPGIGIVTVYKIVKDVGNFDDMVERLKKKRCLSCEYIDRAHRVYDLFSLRWAPRRRSAG
jgi:exonuclease-1